MTVATEMIELLERFGRGMSLPRVAALHLPHPDLAEHKDGEFCALELDDGSIGLSYVLLDDTLAYLRATSGPAGADALEVARRFVTGTGGERTVGFAAINALTRCLFDRAGYVPDASSDSIGGIDPRPGDHVGMVGFFRPLIPIVVETGARLTVLELKPELAGTYDGFDVTLDPDALRTCNKVLSTSTVLLNDTLDRVLACCGGAQRFAVIGPGAACLPDPLFARGVSLIGGSWITDPGALVQALTGASSWSGHARKFVIEAATYPGVAALLTRAGC